MASKLTLEKLKKDVTFLDSVFAAKTDRTKMEEEPVETVPDTEEKDDFIISREEEDQLPGETTAEETTEDADEDEFDLSEISHAPQSREEIIAAAEAAAFAEEQ